MGEWRERERVGGMEGERERWDGEREGERERWGDGEMGGWREGGRERDWEIESEMGRWRERERDGGWRGRERDGDGERERVGGMERGRERERDGGMEGERERDVGGERDRWEGGDGGRERETERELKTLILEDNSVMSIRTYRWCHSKLLPSRRVLCTPYNNASYRVTSGDVISNISSSSTFLLSSWYRLLPSLHSLNAELSTERRSRHIKGSDSCFRFCEPVWPSGKAVGW